MRTIETRRDASLFLKELCDKGLRLSNVREALDAMYPGSSPEVMFGSNGINEFGKEMGEKGYAAYRGHTIVATVYGGKYVVTGPDVRESKVCDNFLKAIDFLDEKVGKRYPVGHPVF
jgi:hypothetical protein